MLTQKYLDELTYEVLGAAIEVQKTIGRGLLETVYHHCMKEELLHRKINFLTEMSVPLIYKDKLIGHLNFDIVANNLVVVQVLTQQQMLTTEQVELNKISLKLTDFEVLLILNFGLEAEHKRVFLSNDYKSR